MSKLVSSLLGFIAYGYFLLLPTLTFSQNTLILDSKFEQKLISLGIDKDGVVNRQMLTANAKGITSLNVSASSISDLTGIEAFVDLRVLVCHSNNLAALDVSKNTALTVLFCHANQLQSLDVSKNTKLIDLHCEENQLQSLDVSKNTALTRLFCYKNQLQSLDISKNTALIFLYCHENQLQSLDVSQNMVLEILYCFSNSLQSLDVSKNTKLIDLHCTSNQLQSLDVRNGNNTKLEFFNATNNLKLTCVSVDDPSWSKANWIKVDPLVVFALDCDNSTLIPDKNFEQKLIDLKIDKDGIINGLMRTADAKGITDLNVSSSNISNLTGIEAFVDLKVLSCYLNLIQSLDVSKNTALTLLYCYTNKLTSLDVSKNTQLRELHCTSNQLQSLDVSKNTALTHLLCNSNQLKSLDVSKNTVLTYLHCTSNQLQSLDMRNGNNTNFFYFDAKNNPQLTCISVDDPVWSTAKLKNVDPSVVFALDCDNSTLIPDKNFEQKLIDLKIDKDGIINGRMRTADAKGITDLNVSSSNISDLTGIETFVDLEVLDCNRNNLTALDISKNTALTLLYCYTNKLTSLDVSKNTQLRELHCTSNQLQSLDVSKNSALRLLLCNSNQLKSLDVSKNTELKDLHCTSNQLQSLDVSKNSALTGLFCYKNKLQSLDVSKNTALIVLFCYENKLQSLDVSKNTALTYLLCGSNQLQSLDMRNGNNTKIFLFNAKDNPQLTCISVDDPAWSTTQWRNFVDPSVVFDLDCNYTMIPDKNFEQKLIDLKIDKDGIINGRMRTADAIGIISLNVSSSNISDLTGIEAFVDLKILLCHTNQLTGLDVSKNILLTDLNCGINQLTNLDVRNNLALTLLNYSTNNITFVDISKNTALRRLFCFTNQLTGLDISKNVALTELNCGDNQLTVLDVSQNVKLSRLDCYANKITHLDVSNNTALTRLWCFENQLPDLNVSKNTALTVLYCHTNQLTDLDISKNVLLTDLNCGINKLTSLDVSKNTVLTLLNYSSNNITFVDISKNTALTGLFCYTNLLTSLDVSKNIALARLNCGRNQLAHLDISKNTALTELLCYSNKLESLDVRNGSNAKIVNFDAKNNPQLTCISVDDPTWSAANWKNVDPSVVFALDCENSTLIPDKNFEQKLIDLKIDKDGIINGRMRTADAKGIDDLDVSSFNISNLTGIEAFVDLKKLNCSENKITRLDLSKNTLLESLKCGSNQLTDLDVTKNLALIALNCGFNKLAHLDVGNNINLQQLYGFNNLLTGLDVSKNSALTEFSCAINQLTGLDVRNSPALKILICNQNQLTDLDVSQNTSLNVLNCMNNKLRHLDVRKNTELTYLFCSSNNLMSLDVRNGNNKKLTNFNAKNNPQLTCISVDDPAWSTANWKNVDPGVEFVSTLCCPNSLIVSITGLNNTYCNNTGIVNLTGTPAGGTFTIDGLPTTSLDPSVLSVGNHTVVYTYIDAMSGCHKMSSQQFTIFNSPVFSTLSVTNAQCSDTQDGKIIVSATGGTGNIMYSIFPNVGTQNGGTFSNLTAQPYTVTATADNRCVASLTADVTLPPTIMITQFSPTTTAQCVGSTATFNAMATGVNMTVKWQKNGQDITLPMPYMSNSLASFTTSPLTSSDNGAIYRAVFQNTCPNDGTMTPGAIVTVNTPSVGGTVSPSQSQACGPTSVHLSLSGINGQVTQWERQLNCTGFWQPIGSAGMNAITVMTPNTSVCYRAVVMSGVCPQDVSSVSTITIDPPAVGGQTILQSNPGLTTVALCPGQNAVLSLRNSIGVVARWQYTFSTSPIWYDLPGSENASELPINHATVTSPKSNTVFFRATIYTQIELCTGLASIAYSSAFRVVQRTSCSSPDGSLVDDNINKNQSLMVAKAYPNPTHDHIYLDIDHGTEGVAELRIMDMMGRVVQSTFQNLESGAHTILLDMHDLANGLYLIQINDSSNHKAVVKVNKF